MANNDIPTYTILEADGQHENNDLEDHLFAQDPTHAYHVRFIRGSLSPGETAVRKPWTEIPKELRDEVDGIMMLKLYLREDDIALFPKLKA